MAEYIDRDALLLRIDCHGTNKFGMLDEDIRAFVKAQPAADVVPVLHERCEFCTDGKTFMGAIALGGNDGRLYKINYCPNCGAKMDGEA